MNKTYLIQRLERPHKGSSNNPFSFGGGLKNGGLSDEAMNLLESIFSFAYMGASEFEWGAVPEALQSIANEASKGNLVKGKTYKVFYICPKKDEKEVVNRIEELLQDERKMRLKEYCGLSDYFNEDYKWSKNSLGWLELNNGFMFFVDQEMFDKTCSLFGLK